VDTDDGHERNAHAAVAHAEAANAAVAPVAAATGTGMGTIATSPGTATASFLTSPGMSPGTVTVVGSPHSSAAATRATLAHMQVQLTAGMAPLFTTLFCSQNTVQLMTPSMVHATNLTPPGSDNQPDAPRDDNPN
jgi:hypothetical protein